MTQRQPTPMQPIEIAKDGVIRFRKNRIIDDLCNFAAQRSGFPDIKCDLEKLSLNEIAIGVYNKRYTVEEWEQLRQLVGYSVSGYGECEIVSKKSVKEADVIGERVWREKERAEKARKAVKANSVKRR